MQLGAVKALEFELIVEAVRSHALTPLGAARLADLRPYTDPRRVESALSATSETARFLANGEALPLRAPADLVTTLAALAVEGRALESTRLMGLADFLESVDETRAVVRRATHGQFPTLRALADTASSFEREVADVRRKIEPSGDLLDQASPELRAIRERLRKQRARLRGTLESYLRGRETARYLQEQVVTERNGRYVLVVKAEHRTAIPGIVHGTSSSGASLFLEPLSTVETNNDIVALEEQEAAEVRRILLALTDAFRTRAIDLHRAIESATELDVLQAKARFAQVVQGIEPVIAGDGRLELRSARHPLLIPAVSEAGCTTHGETALNGSDGRRSGFDESRSTRPTTRAVSADGPVPVDILLVPPTTALVLTGPNTGGKTVALKTAGLLALMAQSGLHIPAADGSRLPVFRSVFADIGDEQSIAANLSTFSWHMTNIAAMDKALALPALVLLDEIGAGTDPVEGGALGMAIVEHFRTRGALVLATTHYDTVKSYAATTEGVTGAAFGFDPDTFAPTYRLSYGSPGRSLAIEIATRLGLSTSIVDAARKYRSVREAQLADHLAKIDRDLGALEQERRLAARERERQAETDARLRAREEALRQREEQFRRRIDEQLDERLSDARREIDRIVAELKLKAAGLAAEAARRAAANEPGLSTGEPGSARADAKTALTHIARRFRDELPDTHPASPPAPPVTQMADTVTGQDVVAVGDRVAISDYGLEGVVRLVHDRVAEVDVRGKRFRVSLDELRVVDRPAVDELPRVNVQINLQPRENVSDLNVIGCTVDEALTRAEKFLDEAIVAEHRTVRFIHGYGTGQLRRALADYLRSHPFVARFTTAPPEHGGGGVTVAELKE